MKTAIECANWAIESAIHSAVSLGSVAPAEAMAILLDTVATGWECNPSVAQSIRVLLQESELQSFVDGVRAEAAEADANGLAWAVDAVRLLFDGDGNLLLLRAAAGIAATDDQVEATLTQMKSKDRIRQSGTFAQERAIAQEILALIDKIEALQTPAIATGK